jgi:phosphonate transport system substrate-binding protein
MAIEPDCAAASVHVDRRSLVLGPLAFATTTALSSNRASASSVFQFGLTPVFLTSDLQLLEALQQYLSKAMEMEVRLVLKRTYQEITSQLLSGQLDAAWICGFPFVAYQPRLELVAVPVWRGRNVYQSYLIEGAGRNHRIIDDLKGDTHAFSDPDSNSGFLVTRSLLAERNVKLESFFARSFFTYGHRNVVRAVASGLAQSGSVDGYVWEVMTQTEPGLTARTRVVWRSDWMGFPPVATAMGNTLNPAMQRFTSALFDMHKDPVGLRVLSLLQLDRFGLAENGLFDSIAARLDLVRRAG